MTDKRVKKCLEKLASVTRYKKAHQEYKRLLDAFYSGKTGKISFKDIMPLSNDERVYYETLGDKQSQLGHDSLPRLAILKVNGGLGTSMGCTGPKSLIEVDNDQSFCDITCQQVTSLRNKTSAQVPFILMNSFYTDKQAKEAMPIGFDYQSVKQNQFPRLEASTGTPFSCPENRNEEWYPPGHGDLFIALEESGVLDNLISKGIDYLFISNADNLAATVDTGILGYIVSHQLDFLMETTPKTLADVKGGSVVWHQNKLCLLERAQVEESEIKTFEDIHYLTLFNTNNLWVNLNSLKKKLEDGLSLPVIMNPKTVYNKKTIQLETAMGAALSQFDNSGMLVVPRHRFLPVKKTSDLLLLRSDFIVKDNDGYLHLNPKRKALHFPQIELGPLFKNVASFEKRVLSPPSLVEARQVTLNGDIAIGKDVTFKGQVDIDVADGQTYFLEETTLEECHIKVDIRGKVSKTLINR